MLKNAIIGAVGIVLASALPAAASVKSVPGISSQPAGVVLAQYKRRPAAKSRRVVTRRSVVTRRYVAGRRYGAAPRGWRRYRARPWNWRTRGCVVVGPLWFCP